MTDFSNTLQALLDFLEKRGAPPPTRIMRVVEIGRGAEVDAHGRYRIRRDELLEPSEYEARFAELMKAGLAWINVSYYGVDDGKLVIAIEVPPASTNAATRTPVSYSGPTATVLDREWRVEEVLVVEPPEAPTS
jgi:hypothetical protein